MSRSARPGVACSAIICLVLLAVPGEPVQARVACLPSTDTVLAFVGDVMLGRGVAEALHGEWDRAFSEVQPWLRAADLAFGNLESPLTTATPVNGRYDLCAPPEAVEALRTGGFDVVSLANNHTMDAGLNGMVDTIAVLAEAGIAHVPPAHHDTSADLQVAFVALDDSTGGLKPDVASEAVGAVAQSAGLVVVSVHWGGEYQAMPSERQRSVARALAGAGADVVIGHGPHVLQPVEWCGETLVAYSLGNFLFDQPYPKDLRWGAVLCVRARAGRAISVVAIPTVVWRGRVHLAGTDDQQAILRRLRLLAPVES